MKLQYKRTALAVSISMIAAAMVTCTTLGP